MPDTPVAISRRAAARFLLEAQDLLAGASAGAATPAVVMREIRRLECVQIDPVAAVERNQHLVLAARVPGYRPPMLEELLRRRRVFEYWANAACAIPIEDYPLFEGTRRRYRRRYAADLASLRAVVRHVRARLESRGPSPARAFVSTHRVRGAWDLGDPKTKATSHALSLLLKRGEIAVVRRDGLERHFDLAQRAVPSALLDRARSIGVVDADRALLQKYLQAYRLVDPGDPRFGWQPMTARKRRAVVDRCVRTGRLVRVEIEGVPRPYFVAPEAVEGLQRHARAAEDRGAGRDGARVRFLAPLDNLLWRRSRVLDLFRFAYTWEVYLPVPKRRYGHYVMPILWGERLIGRLDPQLDRIRGRLVIRLLRLEPGVRPTRALRDAMHDALASFARFHGADGMEIRPAARPTLRPWRDGCERR